jgi:hypothetical protein
MYCIIVGRRSAAVERVHHRLGQARACVRLSHPLYTMFALYIHSPVKRSLPFIFSLRFISLFPSFVSSLPFHFTPLCISLLFLFALDFLFSHSFLFQPLPIFTSLCIFTPRCIFTPLSISLPFLFLHPFLFQPHFYLHSPFYLHPPFHLFPFVFSLPFVF